MSKLRDLQLTQLAMLKEVDRICKKHDIKYMLFSGTMLGAVREKGFIPWDDDLDIIMLRAEYERFLKVAPNELKKEYYLQAEFSEKWPMHFSKLRKNNTAYIERFIPRIQGIHMGVCIDIFPCDNLSKNKLMQRLQFLSSRIVLAYTFGKKGYMTKSLLKKTVIAVSKCLPWKLFYSFALGEKNKNSEYVHSFFGGTSKMERGIYRRVWFEELQEMPFEDGLFPVSVHYDEILSIMYGDYMTPTPEADRECKVHAEIVDLENSYEKYLDVQKNMEVKVYSRSIR